MRASMSATTSFNGSSAPVHAWPWSTYSLAGGQLRSCALTGPLAALRAAPRYSSASWASPRQICRPPGSARRATQTWQPPMKMRSTHSYHQPVHARTAAKSRLAAARRGPSLACAACSRWHVALLQRWRSACIARQWHRPAAVRAATTAIQLHGAAPEPAALRLRPLHRGLLCTAKQLDAGAAHCHRTVAPS